MNSFHENTHHHHHNPRTRLLLSPSEPYRELRIRKTLSIAFVTVFFIAIGYLILNSICDCLHRHRRRLGLRDLDAPSTNHNITIDIVPGGASDAQLRAIPVLVFGSTSSPSSNNGGGGTEEKESCSVCLAEYVEGEEVRVLPRCKHMFHKACIDQWLITRSPFCPICRDKVIERDACRNGDESHRSTSALRMELEVRVNMAPHPHVSPFL
ncbi:RING-H2 finger protein ATL64-like [Cocos nucifera]|uniref:RING-H2 finger protein ATL64-like n=1 Tax=Cocos nucifera TaxID=13894 RepID=A0A8K0IJB0_COCNU|nr:RING-H2 finger protein ATL64-like [Cocos nucifera]